jgi:hypothetical protein
MTLIPVFNGSFTFPSNQIVIPHQFSKNCVVIEVNTNHRRETWNMAGWLIPILLYPELGSIQSSYRRVFFGKSLVKIPSLEVSYNLQFKPVYYLVDITLTIWEYYKEDVGDTLKRIEQKIDSFNNFEIN